MEKVKKVLFLAEVVDGIFPDMRASFDQKTELMWQGCRLFTLPWSLARPS